MKPTEGHDLAAGTPGAARGEASPVSVCGAPEGPEPTAAETFQTPMWLVGLLGLLLYWGSLYMDQNGGEFHPLVFNQGDRPPDVEARVPKSEADALRNKGRLVYDKYCAACHQTHGKGEPGRFPPLVDSEWVLAPGPNRIIRILLNGFQGPVTVKGAEYNNVMVPWRDQLTDEDVAAVLTFVRVNKDWGHSATPVLPGQVKTIRAATEARGGTAWTAPELQAVAEKD